MEGPSPAHAGTSRLRCTLALAACAAALAAGCGSAKSSAGSRATTGPATGSGTGAPAAAGSAATSTESGSSLKVASTPRYASPSPSAPVHAGTVQVAYRAITIEPDVLRVKVGSTLRWTNYDPVEHNVTSKSGPQRFVSHNFAEGQSFQVTLTRPGLYHYECTIHPATMNGTIEVVR